VLAEQNGIRGEGLVVESVRVDSRECAGDAIKDYLTVAGREHLRVIGGEGRHRGKEARQDRKSDLVRREREIPTDWETQCGMADPVRVRDIPERRKKEIEKLGIGDGAVGVGEIGREG
jgi:hypothetical protein